MDWIVFAVYLSACFAAGATGAAFPPGRWYEELRKPSWTPPNGVFPVAWLILYICMALAATRVSATANAALPLAFWALQIALNALWTPIFFGLRRLGGGLLVLSLMWLAVAGATALFFQQDPIAGWLFVPYLVWTSYAWALNFAIWRTNPEGGPAVA